MLVEACTSFVASHSHDQRFSKEDFEVLFAASKVVVIFAPSLKHTLTTLDASSALRQINLFTFASVKSLASKVHHVLELSSQLSDCLAITLRNCNQVMEHADGSHSAPAFVSEQIAHAFVAVKLWLLLVRHLGSGEEEEAIFWNGAFPPLADLIETVAFSSSDSVGDFPYIASQHKAEVDAQQMMTTVIRTSFIDLVLFMHQVGSALIAKEAPDLLELLEALSGTSRPSTRYIKAQEAFDDPLPRSKMDVLLHAAQLDLFACCKLRHEMM